MWSMTLLAFLADKMLEMNKQKHQEIKGFLGWLESEIGSKVEDLSLKMKVKHYKLKFDELLAVLKKNKQKLAIDPARREEEEEIEIVEGKNPR